MCITRRKISKNSFLLEKMKRKKMYNYTHTQVQEIKLTLWHRGDKATLATTTK